MKLLIATPTQGLWTPEFGNSLAWTMADLVRDSRGVEQVRHNWVNGTLLSQVRTDLAKEALKIKATHILWADCDMKFSPENVRKLIAHSDKDIVGCNYIRRIPPHTSVAIGMDGMYLKPKKSGLEAVNYTGMGLMLTKTKVFEELEEPWFLQPWVEDMGATIGEDVWFCRLARDHSMDVFVDHAASIGVGHVTKDVLAIEMEEKPKPKLELVHGVS